MAFPALVEGRKQGTLNMPPSVQNFKPYVDLLHNATRRVAQNGMATGAVEVAECEHSNDVVVTVDGRWTKRGHTSMVGVVSVIAVDNGKILYSHCSSEYSHSSSLITQLFTRIKALQSTKSLKKLYSVEWRIDYSGTFDRNEISGAIKCSEKPLEVNNRSCTKHAGNGDIGWCVKGQTGDVKG